MKPATRDLGGIISKNTGEEHHLTFESAVRGWQRVVEDMEHALTSFL